MLRITLVADEDASATLKVEGGVVSEASSVLERECLRYLEAKQRLLLDFSGVTLVDCRGAETLKRLQFRNVRLINCSPLIDEMIQECAG